MAFFAVVLLASCQEKEEPTALTFDNNDISYIDKGRGKLSVVFIHGWCADKEYWQSQIDAFSGKYRTIALDLAGHGTSSARRDNWTPENFARDVVAVVNELELKNVVLVGHSIAEDVLLRASRMLPERTVAVVGIENFKQVDIEMTDSLKGEVNRFFRLLQYDYKGAVKAFAYDRLLVPRMDPKVRGRILRDVVEADTSIAIPILRFLFEDYEEERQFLKELIRPLYVINSNYVPTDVSKLEKYCANGFYYRELEGCGHYPMIEKPEELNAHLGEVLEEIETNL